jgi:hypothetical protein
MPRLIAISALLVFAGVGPALAEDNEWSRDGLYLALILSVPFQTTEKGVDIEPGFGGRGGYRFHPHFSGEVQFEWLSPRDINRGGSKAAKLKTVTATANAKGYLLTGRIQPYLLTGIGLMHSDLDGTNVGFGGLPKKQSDDFLARFGGGVEIYIDPETVLTLESNYMLPTGDASDLDHVLVSFGIQIRF